MEGKVVGSVVLGVDSISTQNQKWGWGGEMCFNGASAGHPLKMLWNLESKFATHGTELWNLRERRVRKTKKIIEQ